MAAPKPDSPFGAAPKPTVPFGPVFGTVPHPDSPFGVAAYKFEPPTHFIPPRQNLPNVPIYSSGFGQILEPTTYKSIVTINKRYIEYTSTTTLGNTQSRGLINMDSIDSLELAGSLMTIYCNDRRSITLVATEDHYNQIKSFMGN